ARRRLQPGLGAPRAGGRAAGHRGDGPAGARGCSGGDAAALRRPAAGRPSGEPRCGAVAPARRARTPAARRTAAL
ncbi:MAG: hypothetical protein AVDCRST_MAG61-2194, partial [uncultured Friedmanniella sp.]